MPTVSVVGRPDRSGAMSEPVTVMVVEAELLAVLRSLVAPVEPATDEAPAVVGVPVTEHEMVPPAATVVGGTGAHVDVRPAGKPDTAQLAAVAAMAGAAALVQV